MINKDKVIKLNPCPCGKTPTKLNIQDGDTYRWRVISGDCCGTWMIESSRIAYQADSKTIEKQCIDDWNEATEHLTAQALEAHIVGDGEPIGKLEACYITPNAVGTYYNGFHSKSRLNCGQSIFTAPPNYAELKAECERYRKALEDAIAYCDAVSGNYSTHGIRKLCQEALGKVE